MNDPSEGQSEPVAETPTADVEPHTARERRLEVEVARLKAEIADLHGTGSVEATSRFLAMAADTIDQAMNETRQEADRTRADAANLTASALAEVVEMRSLAELQMSEMKIRAEAEAAELKALAETEAGALVKVERARLADEIDALQEVRGVLEAERLDLENYHTELRRRVQELAESMVSFMTTESPLPSAALLDGVSLPELGGVSPVPPPQVSDRDPLAEFAGLPAQPHSGDDQLEAATWPGADGLYEGINQMIEDDRFQAFIGGDEGFDKSRDWLLRTDNS